MINVLITGVGAFPRSMGNPSCSTLSLIREVVSMVYAHSITGSASKSGRRIVL